MNNIIWNDLKFFLTRLKYLSVSESLALGNNGGFCVSTNCASENWIYYPERVRSPEIASEAVKFFSDRKISFMWPLYDGGGEVLEDAGLLYAGKLKAMSLNPETHKPQETPSIKIIPVTSPEESRLWAQGTWSGFEYGTDDIPENYYALIDAFYNDTENLSLYLAEHDGQVSGTFMTVNEAELLGVYYFAVVPEMRRKGIARAMMNEICRLSSGRVIVLQATPSGVPFYRSFGFDELFEIPVYSTERDIF